MNLSKPRPAFFIAEYSRFNGSQRSLLQLIRTLKDRGLDTLTLFPGDGICVERYVAAGVPVEIVPGPPIAHRFGQDLLRISRTKQARILAELLPYGAELTRRLLATRRNILHLNTARATLLAGIVPKLAGFPVVLHVRGELGVFGAFQREVVANVADRLILVAHSLMSEFPGRHSHKCVALYNAIDDHAFARSPESERREHPSSAHEHRPATVLCVGAVTPAKGQHQLLEALAILKQRSLPAFETVILGEMHNEPYKRHLDQLVQRYNLNNVRFAGWAQYPRDYYEAADIIVLPSVQQETIETAEGTLNVRSGEGLPRAIVEAMYVGKASVSTRVAGIPEMIEDGKSGLIVSPGSATELAEALAFLLSNPGERARMGREAAARAKLLFSSDRLADGVTEVYRDLLARRSGSLRGKILGALNAT